MTSQSSVTAQQLNLLLLPPPPSDISFASFEAAYGPSLKQVLIQVAASVESSLQPILDIAIRCEQSKLNTDHTRSTIYPYAQRILSALYKLACYICAEKDGKRPINEDTDFRVILVFSNTPDIDPEARGSRQLVSQGPAISLKALAHSIRPWSNVYAIDGEHGEAFLHSFTKHRKYLPFERRAPIWETRRVPGGTSIIDPGLDAKTEETSSSAKKHYSVALGGTFDHLHAGHKLLLSATAFLIQQVTQPSEIRDRCLTVGITGDELLKNKKHAQFLESWEERQKAVIHFLSAVMNFDSSCDDLKVERVSNKGPNGKAMNYKMDGNLTIRCVEISDPFGPTITDEAISALVVSAETRSGGRAVNDKRAEKGWPLLQVFEVDVLDASAADKEAEVTEREGFQSKISSTEIRKQLHERQARGLHL